MLVTYQIALTAAIVTWFLYQKPRRIVSFYELWWVNRQKSCKSFNVSDSWFSICDWN
eukprot:UN02128